MPVRIYDIAKKLGVENKEVLVKAKEMGIKEAKVPSSSLDKITAEYLENELRTVLGLSSTPVEAPPPPPLEPVFIKAEPPPPAPEPTVVEEAPVAVESAPVAVESEPVSAEQTPVEEVPAAAHETVVAGADLPSNAAPAVEAAAPDAEIPPAPLPPPPLPLAPPAPPAPVIPPPAKVGDKVGFIKLPVKAVARPSDRPAPGTSAPGNRTDQRGRPGDRPQQGRGQFQHRGPGQGMGQRPPYSGSPARTEPPKPVVAKPTFNLPADAPRISIKPPIIVRELAEHLRRKPFQLIADLMELGVFATVNQAIEEITAQKLCAKHGFVFELERRAKGEGNVHAPIKPKEPDSDDKSEDLKPRAPVVTIMGHVDHGKTTLLDVIRKTSVAAGEAGGITQHIGAYTISIPHPERANEMQQITFLDTPGHAAFSSMRARGANVTDLVILVVAANDGVMPQTLEALSHARAAKVPIIVAVNKSDHPNANPMKVRQQLQDKGLVCEEWGGETIFVDVSALTKQGIDKLLEMVVLQTDVLELKANPLRPAKGNVIESGLEQGGPTATVLVRKGTLKVGDTVICGHFYGRVRALVNEEGKRQKEAGPSVAVRVLGLNGVPEAGIEFSVIDNEKMARSVAEERVIATKAEDSERRPKVTLENLFATLGSDQSKVLRVVVKADTQGSVEAIVEALKKIDGGKVALDVIHSAVGTVTESDVLLASASKAIVLGFHTRIDNGVAEVSKREAVQIKLYAIIYELIDQVRDSMSGLLDPVMKEVVTGSAEVRQIFTLSKGGNVAGCVVASGRINKGKVRVMRRKNLVFEGVTLSLRRFQDEVNEVRAGMECGIRIDGFNEFQTGDAIECYMMEKVPQKL